MAHDPKAEPFVGQILPNVLKQDGDFLCCPNCGRNQLTGAYQPRAERSEIEFYCDGCGFVGELQFESRKGCTSTRWVRTFVSCEAEMFAGLPVDEHG